MESTRAAANAVANEAAAPIITNIPTVTTSDVSLRRFRKTSSRPGVAPFLRSFIHAAPHSSVGSSSAHVGRELIDPRERGDA